MTGIYGTHPEDVHYERMLNEYLDSLDNEPLFDDNDDHEEQDVSGWYCVHCGEFVKEGDVTMDEIHTVCGNRVIWEG